MAQALARQGIMAKGKVVARRMRMPRQVCSTRKSLSLLTMISAPAARAGSKYLSSLGSRQSVTRTEGSNQMAMPRRASKNCRRRTNEMTFANFGRLSTSAISVSTGADKASTSISSARNNALRHAIGLECGADESRCVEDDQFQMRLLCRSALCAASSASMSASLNPASRPHSSGRRRPAREG
jgi:hypothetical protein